MDRPTSGSVEVGGLALERARADDVVRLDHGVLRSSATARHTPSGLRRSRETARGIPAPSTSPRRWRDRLAPTVLALRHVSKSYTGASEVIHALRDVSAEVAEGELVALVGRSGSRKTTLLNVAARGERRDEGEVELDAGSPGPPSWSEVAVLPQ